jgi:CubicO group peptidase (beta-lactamase class C family)
MDNRSLSFPAVSLLLIVLLTAQPSAIALGQKPDLGELEKVALAEMKETETPGAAIAIISGDRVIFAKGFGVANLETQIPVTPDTLFQIGSMTKMFTAAALVTLAAEGKLRLDKPIGSYVKGLSAKLSQVTVHQLLSHTAGLQDEPDEYGLHDESALADYARSWKDDYCLLEPGQCFSYSNSGIALAGLVLQEIGGQLYAEQMSERLFQPLGMNRTTFRPTVAMTYPTASGHRVRRGEKLSVVRPMADDARLWPAGNMFTNVTELSRFVIAFLNGGKIEGQQALPPAVIAQMSKPRAEVPAFAQYTQYGYCLFMDRSRGMTQVWHDGSMPGFFASLMMVPNHRFAVLMLTNKEGWGLKKTQEKAMELLLPLTAKEAAKPKTPQPISVAEMSKYVGTYSNPKRWEIEIVMKESKLFIKEFGMELPLTKIGEHRFSFQLSGARQPQEIVVTFGENGQPLYLHQYVWAFKRRAR